MSKRILAAVMAVIMLAGCQNSKGSSSSAAAGNDEFSKNPVKTDAVFEFKDMEEYMCLMAFSPPSDSGTALELAVNIPNEYDIEETAETQYNTNYNLYHYESKKSYGTFRVQTAPKDLAAHFKTQESEKIKDLMAPDFFTTELMYQGLKNSILNDFGYELAVDWTGTAYGWNAYYMEFIDKDSGNRGLRFYVCNDEINEKFYAFEYKANVPIGDEQLLKMCREVIFSLQQL